MRPNTLARAAGLAILATAVFLRPPISAQTKFGKQPITIEDLVTYTRMRNVRLSPDGKWVSYLTLKPLVEENRFDCAVWLQRTHPNSESLELARFQTTSGQTYSEGGALKHFGGQLMWSPDSRYLAYTSRSGDKVPVRLHLFAGSDIEVTGNALEAQLLRWSDDSTAFLLKTTEEVAEPPSPDGASIRVTDDQTFWGSSWAKVQPTTRKVRALQYKLASHELIDVTKDEQEKSSEILPRTYKDAKWPSRPNDNKTLSTPIVSPDRKFAVFVGAGTYNNGDHRHAYRDYFVGIKRIGDAIPPKEFLHSPYPTPFLHWTADSKQVYGLFLDAEYTALLAIAADDGAVREVMRTSHRLTDSSWNKDSTSFVAIRQSAFMPDELVKFDLETKQFRVLASPNHWFVDKDLPTVRFMRVNNPLDGGIFGRLVLPNSYVKGRRYPLVFVTYRAGTGFLEGGIGDEFPIFPFAANGFAVFALDTGISNMTSESGNLDFTLLRYRKPLEAMEILRSQLADEGFIDPGLCGISGLSYGSNITAYAVATTNVFKAATMGGADLDPSAYVLASANLEKGYEAYGYPYPDDVGRKHWKKSSIALNAARVTTPLLIQSPESEATASIETFKALRHYGVPVEWYVYLNEGHVKFQPRTKYLVYQRNLDWMNFWLQDKEDPDPNKQEQYKRWRAMREEFQKRHPATARP